MTVSDSSRPSRPEDITAAVLASFADAPETRQREVLRALARHLHAFASEVGLREEEWASGIEILTRSGEISDAHRSEFVLWSDVLGLSMLVDALTHQLPQGATESTVLGPFYAAGSPIRPYGANLASEPSGTPAWVHGRVLDLDRRPVGDAELDVWQNGSDRLYAVQRPEAPESHLRARLRSREDGGYAFLGVAPAPYQIPSDCPVGAMLSGAGRHPWRPAHIHMIVRAPGYRTLVTHIFDRASEFLDSDAVFAVKPSLLRDFVARSAADPDAPDGVSGDWVSVENDIVLAPDGRASD